MTEQPNLKKNYAYNMAYQVLALLVPFVTIPYVSRVLGASGVGTYSFSLSAVTYFMMVAALGVQGYGSREISRLRDDRARYSKEFWEISLLVGLTTVACTVAWVCLAFASTGYTLYFMGLAPMLVSVAFDISWFYIGLEKMGHVVLRNTIVKVLGVVLLFALVRTADDLMTYILINSCVQLAGNASMWATLPGMVDRPRLREMKLGLHFKETLVYFVPALATTLYTVLNKTMIGLITGDPFQNGYYEQADKVIRMAMTLTFTSVNVVMGARLAYLFEKGAVDEARERAHKSLDFILLLAYAFTFGIAGVASFFVPVFFGEGYEPVILLLWLMCPLIVVIGVSNCLGTQYYTPSGRRAQSARYILIGAASNIALSLALIPPLGMYGAVAGSAAAEVLITTLYIARCNRFIKLSAVWTRSWKRIIAGLFGMMVAMGCATILELPGIAVLLVQVVIFAIVYFGLLSIMQNNMMFYLFGWVRNRFPNRSQEEQRDGRLED